MYGGLEVQNKSQFWKPNYKRKCKYKKQNNNSENTTTIPKTL